MYMSGVSMYSFNWRLQSMPLYSFTVVYIAYWLVKKLISCSIRFYVGFLCVVEYTFLYSKKVHQNISASLFWPPLGDLSPTYHEPCPAWMAMYPGPSPLQGLKVMTKCSIDSAPQWSVSQFHVWPKGFLTDLQVGFVTLWIHLTCMPGALMVYTANIRIQCNVHIALLQSYAGQTVVILSIGHKEERFEKLTVINEFIYSI